MQCVGIPYLLASVLKVLLNDPILYFGYVVPHISFKFNHLEKIRPFKDTSFILCIHIIHLN